MRSILLATLMAALLVATPVALADDDDDNDRRADRREKWDDRRDAAEERREARASHRAADDENRSALFASFKENMTILHEAWRADSAAIREACKALLPENATKAERKEAAHCVRDGYREWRALHREDIHALRDAFKSLMQFGRGHHHD